MTVAPLRTPPSGYRSAFSLGGRGRVQRHGGADRRLERPLVGPVALENVDGAPYVAFKGDIEKT
jgi:hypothetical protein